MTYLIAAAAAAAALAVPAGSSAAGGAPAGTTQKTAEQIGLDAYVYGTPLMAFERQAKQQTSVTVPNDLSDAPVNQLGNAGNLADVAHQVFVQPNNDTLYTMGHLDLTQGPLVLHVPNVANYRYYTFEFLDPYTNVFHYVGTRTTGDGAGNYAIVGPPLPRKAARRRSPHHIQLRARLALRPHARQRSSRSSGRA